ncbi:MAG: response regulator transcription factor [Bacillota bacterium]
MRILLIDSDPAEAQGFELALKSEGFSVTTTDLGEEGIEFARNYEYELILIALELTDMIASDIIRTLRNTKVRTPIVIFSLTAGPETRIKCLDLGADDFLFHQFQPPELATRIRSIVRRAHGHMESVITVGNLVISLNSREFSVDGKRTPLPPLEHRLLILLGLRKGRMVSRESLFATLFGEDGDQPPRMVDSVIARLRRKIAKANGGVNYIQTEYKTGYGLFEPDTEPGTLLFFRARRTA